MSTVTNLKAIAETQLPVKLKFVYADREYANWIIDNWSKEEFPIVVMLPIVTDDSKTGSGMLKGELDFNAYFLDRYNGDTIQFNHLEVDALYIEPMKLIARKFLHKVDESAMSDPETNGIESAKHTPAYQVFDAHTFGVFTQCSIPVVEGVNVCV